MIALPLLRDQRAREARRRGRRPQQPARKPTLDASCHAVAVGRPWSPRSHGSIVFARSARCGGVPHPARRTPAAHRPARARGRRRTRALRRVAVRARRAALAGPARRCRLRAGDAAWPGEHVRARHARSGRSADSPRRVRSATTPCRSSSTPIHSISSVPSRASPRRRREARRRRTHGVPAEHTCPREPQRRDALGQEALASAKPPRRQAPATRPLAAKRTSGRRPGPRRRWHRPRIGRTARSRVPRCGRRPATASRGSARHRHAALGRRRFRAGSPRRRLIVGARRDRCSCCSA